MRRTKRRKARASSVTVTCEDDGTQVERIPSARRRSSTVRRTQVDTPEFRNAFREFCLQVNKIGVQGLITEFTTMRAQTQPIGTKPKLAFDANPRKNRYKDVFCTDESRVVLTWPPGTNDYIHANWVSGSEIPKKFICTQMVLQGCNLKLRYVKTQNVEENILQTTVEVSIDDSNKHTVEHIQWKDWPDRGVPPTNLSSFRLLMRVRRLTPIVVHCSAGIGRTGTIVGLDLLYSKLEKGMLVTLESVVRGLRNDRHGSVQTEVQYLYMHRILLAVAENKKVIAPGDVQKFMTDYDTFCKAKGYI